MEWAQVLALVMIPGYESEFFCLTNYRAQNFAQLHIIPGYSHSVLAWRPISYPTESVGKISGWKESIIKEGNTEKQV